MNMKTVAEVKQIASQLGKPGSGSPCIEVEVHSSSDIEVSVDCMGHVRQTTPQFFKYYPGILISGTVYR